MFAEVVSPPVSVDLNSTRNSPREVRYVNTTPLITVALLVGSCDCGSSASGLTTFSACQGCIHTCIPCMFSLLFLSFSIIPLLSLLPRLVSGPVLPRASVLHLVLPRLSPSRHRRSSCHPPPAGLMRNGKAGGSAELRPEAPRGNPLSPSSLVFSEWLIDRVIHGRGVNASRPFNFRRYSSFRVLINLASAASFRPDEYLAPSALAR